MSAYCSCRHAGISTDVKQEVLSEYREKLRSALLLLATELSSVSLRKEYSNFEKQIEDIKIAIPSIMLTLDKEYTTSNEYIDLLQSNDDRVSNTELKSALKECEANFENIFYDGRFSQLHILVYYIKILEIIETLESSLKKMQVVGYRKRRKTPLPEEIRNERIEKQSILFKINCELLYIVHTIIRLTE